MSEANTLKSVISQKRTLLIGAVAAVVLLALLAVWALTGSDDANPGKPGASAGDSVVPAPAVPPGLKTVSYTEFQSGWPADPDPTKIDGITEGVHPLKTVALYDAVGGKARTKAAPEIARGVDLVMPVIDEKSGWVAVIVPSTNRSVAWIPDKDLERRPLRDHIVIERKAHKLTWYTDDKPQKSWEVTLGTAATPTPLGRSYVLGRSKLPGAVYAGVDVLALSSVPDDPSSVPAGLRGAHTGIHTWHNDNNLGKDVSDGCIRLTKSGHELLLKEIEPGTPVTILP
ncbi:MAG TPA: L,D-transpeptidase [Mycobacteriales bacterium]|nr:L,D-transpeptidase [Mycobacteriales bacterium]